MNLKEKQSERNQLRRRESVFKPLNLQVQITCHCFNTVAGLCLYKITIQRSMRLHYIIKLHSFVIVLIERVLAKELTSGAFNGEICKIRS